MHTYVIAEAGVNHNGSIDLALSLVDAAVDAGADAVKFQTFRANALVSKHAPKAEYQDRAIGHEQSHYDMIRSLELSHEAHVKIQAHCRERKITFLSTPFDIASADFLIELGVERLKVPSGDVVNVPLLRRLGRSGLPAILSTGMATLGEVEAGLGALASGALGSEMSWADAFRSDEGQAWLAKNVTILHCTTEYPAPVSAVNLRAMDTLREAFGLPVGYSDHTEGISVAVAAVARGAVLVEKHFTLDRTMTGPDHAASLEPNELKQMVRAIRDVEAALGSPIKRPSAAERKNMAPARRSLIALRKIAVGEPFTAENLGVKRPGTGVSPLCYDDYLGRRADRDYAEDDLIR